MKPSFHPRLINGPFDDPGLYVRILREGRALMFDLGSVSSLSPRDILKITDVFISHTHIDHFIGFDNVLRISLKKETPLRLYGPEGFIDRIEGKLKGYTWNLIEDYPVVLNVSEVCGSMIRRAVFRAENTFKRENTETAPFQGVLLTDPFCKVSAVVLDHHIPCLAFSIEEDYHINIDKDKLKRMNLPVGPWLGELKTAIRENALSHVLTVNGKAYACAELKDVANITKGQKITYVADVLGSKENVDRIIGIAQGADVLYIEAYFSDEDGDRAKERYHLTAKEAGIIAGRANVGRIEPFHFSPRYTDEPERLSREAQEAFEQNRLHD
ncbi:MAG: ribonuclease Z [Nitrospiraceae bacterium]|nr:MAG: ribonuclease Z [Nitrospiraceae bacterium]